MTDTYYLRATSRAELIDLGIDLGLLFNDDGVIMATSSEIGWDEIGTIDLPTGAVGPDGVPLTAPVTDASGNVYWHANLYMPYDLMTWAQAKALAYAGTERGNCIVAAIANSANYFPLDAVGQPRKPISPVRVLWQ